MREITLTQNKVALVDDDDYELLMQYKWCAHFSYTEWYAVSRIDGKVVKMHHLLLPRKSGLDVDHINGNGLDNQRLNLRYATRAQNLQNRVANHNSTSQFVGVYWDSWANKWRACIKKNGKKYNLGRFTDEREAALARDLAALDLFGDHAKMNVLETT